MSLQQNLSSEDLYWSLRFGIYIYDQCNVKFRERGHTDTARKGNPTPAETQRRKRACGLGESMVSDITENLYKQQGEERVGKRVGKMVRTQQVSISDMGACLLSSSR